MFIGAITIVVLLSGLFVALSGSKRLWRYAAIAIMANIVLVIAAYIALLMA